MSEVFVNVYHCPTFGVQMFAHGTAEIATERSMAYSDGERFQRIYFGHCEWRINAHWHRPPVGMQARDASHFWVWQVTPAKHSSNSLESR